MTSFQKSQLPDGINTVEELLVWSASVLAEVNAAEMVAADRSSNVRVVDARGGILEFATTDPERFIVAAYIPQSPSHRTLKAWFNGVKEISTNPIPSAYTANS